MIVSARVQNSLDNHQVTLITNEQSQSLQISTKPSVFGSSASGGELLFLALATCYCNDIHLKAQSGGGMSYPYNVSNNSIFYTMPVRKGRDF
ncbi:MAG: hypothetical protein A2W35_09020 [Chloroflexi bacterium RBG_16_57_11]|nr:MAG: hypothetical protein A2W35_09020 [Chloroflexi bacterium RBG_16_57_11]